MGGERASDGSREVPSVEPAENASPGLGKNALLGPSPYRWAALGLVAVGLLAAAGGVVFSGVREVLFSLAATGLFGSVLVILLGSGRRIPDAVAKRVYETTAKNQAAVAESLGLSGQPIYVPTDEGVVLIVPQNDGHHLLTEPITVGVTDDRAALVLEPIGSGLFREVNRAVASDLERGLEMTAEVLTEGMVEILEIAHEADATIHSTDGNMTIGVSGASFGDLDRFDHPIPSYLAVGVGRELDRPVTIEVRQTDGSADWLVTCSWDADEKVSSVEPTDSDGRHSDELSSDYEREPDQSEPEYQS